MRVGQECRSPNISRNKIPLSLAKAWLAFFCFIDAQTFLTVSLKDADFVGSKPSTQNLSILQQIFFFAHFPCPHRLALSPPSGAHTG